MTNLRDMLDSAARNLAAETEKLTGARTEAAALNSDKLRLTSELEDLKGKLEASQRMVGQLEGQLQTVKTELTMKSEQYVTTDSELQALRKSLTDELDTEKMRYCSLCVLLSIYVLFAMCQPLALSVGFSRLCSPMSIPCQSYISSWCAMFICHSYGSFTGNSARLPPPFSRVLMSCSNHDSSSSLCRCHRFCLISVSLWQVLIPCRQKYSLRRAEL